MKYIKLVLTSILALASISFAWSLVSDGADNRLVPKRSPLENGWEHIEGLTRWEPSEIRNDPVGFLADSRAHLAQHISTCNDVLFEASRELKLIELRKNDLENAKAAHSQERAALAQDLLERRGRPEQPVEVQAETSRLENAYVAASRSLKRAQDRLEALNKHHKAHAQTIVQAEQQKSVAQQLIEDVVFQERQLRLRGTRGLDSSMIKHVQANLTGIKMVGSTIEISEGGEDLASDGAYILSELYRE